MRDIINRPSDQSERAIVAFACVLTCVLASAHAIWKAVGHHINAVDPRRLELCLLLIVIAYWTGFEHYLLQWRGMPRNAPPRRLTLSPKYRSAFRAGIVIRLIAFVFLNMILMAGMNRLSCAILLGDLAGILLIVFRRPQSPTADDLRFIRFGILGIMGIIMALLVFVSSFR